MRVQLSGPVGLRVGMAVVVLGAVLAPSAAAAPKTDVVVLENGDRLTCEVKGFSRGRLTCSTDNAGTVNVYWDRIAHLTSTQLFEVETTDGLLYYGQLTSPTARRLVATAANTSIDLAMGEVIRLTPLAAHFYQRIDGNVDLGFSLTRANNEVRYTLNSNAAYHGRRYLGSATLASQFTQRDDADRVSRNSLTAYGARALRDRWFAMVLGQTQSNEELSLDLRWVAGGGAGRYALQSNATKLMLFGGLVYTTERYSDSPEHRSAEAVTGAQWDLFNARNNDYDLTTTLTGFYDITGDARVRSEFQTALRFKIFSDFTFSINGYDSYDSHPPQDGVKNDYGVTLSLGWSF